MYKYRFDKEKAERVEQVEEKRKGREKGAETR
jgi:hypothetical protein